MSSCNYFSNNNTKNQKLDRKIDFNSVDLSPAFLSCEALGGTKRAECFRKEICKRITNTLNEPDFIVNDDIDETVVVHLMIYKTGEIKLKRIQSSKNIADKLPLLDSVLKASIKKLPKVKPAMKENLSVTTQYKLPIKISINSSQPPF